MRIHFSLIILVNSILLMSCASNRLITIDTNPQGAKVIADGREIGITPLKIEPDEAFPPRWFGSSYLVKGNLELKKSECEPVSMKVNDRILSKDITRQLDCSDKSDTPTNQTNDVPARKNDNQALPIKDDITQRLEKLNQLHEKDLISNEEYQTQRQRILNEL